jgi:serine/threonine-protein kinase
VNAPTRIAPRVGGSERFEVGGLLGEGIYAQVYRATDTKLNRLVALKFIRPDVAGNNALEHARALARVQHPNIVTVYEVLDVANPVTGAVIPTVVMELIDGISLTERIGCSIERDELRRIGDALLDAIAAYHASNLAHLDLHDHNVIVGHPLVKVLDAIYFDTAALSSTATRSAQQAKDVRSVRDIIEQMLYSGGVSTEVAVTFLHATARRDLNLTLLRAAFDAAIP